MHVREVVLASEKFGRLIHINTSGIHDQSQNIVPHFTKTPFKNCLSFHNNLLTMWDSQNTSIHIASSLSPSIYPENMDIINAYSCSLKSYEEEQALLGLKNQKKLNKGSKHDATVKQLKKLRKNEFLNKDIDKARKYLQETYEFSFIKFDMKKANKV